jgi:hypothetical protein
MTLLKLIIFSAVVIIGCYTSTSPTSESRQKEGAEPEKITLCQLTKNRAAYNHKLIQVTGFVSHGFEDFTLFDPGCSSRLDVWLEYGGTEASGTMYCCGVTAVRSRPKQLVVEHIPIRLIDDTRFREFDKLLQRRPDSVVHATIIGRFFSGQQTQYANGLSWGGYGHMGCCSLLAIEQVVSVDPHDREDLDYGASPDQPQFNGAGCWSKDLYSDWSGSESIQSQKRADEGERDWSFDDPRRVAAGELARITKLEEKSLTGMKETRREPGRIVYQWHPKARHSNYMIVVSRPYLLSFYAKDPKKVAWVVTAGYEYGCN